MPGNFKTYGPFQLPRSAGVVDAACLKMMWGDEASSLPEGLNDAIGIYIIAVQTGSKKPIPLYVGRTERGFESRFKQHVSSKKIFASLGNVPEKAKLLVFFIALHTPSRGAFRKRAKRDAVRAIKALEFMLIGKCLNSELLNTSQSTVHRALQGLGYLNDQALIRDDSSAQLAEMLVSLKSS